MSRKIAVIYIVTTLIFIIFFSTVIDEITFEKFTGSLHGAKQEDILLELYNIVFFAYLFFQGFVVLDYYENYNQNFMEFIKYRVKSYGYIQNRSIIFSIKASAFQLLYILLLTIIIAILRENKLTINIEVILNIVQLAILLTSISYLQYLNNWYTKTNRVTFLLIICFIFTLFCKVNLMYFSYILFLIYTIFIIIRRRKND